MLRRSPLKPKRKKAPTAAEARHMDRIARMGCLVCGAPATVHHISASIHGGRVTRSNKRTAPLCPVHHQIQWGPKESVEALSHAGFYREYGIDLLDWADKEWEKSCAS